MIPKSVQRFSEKIMRRQNAGAGRRLVEKSSRSGAELVPRGTRQRLFALLLRSAARVALQPILSPRIPIQWQRWWLKRLMSLAPTGRRTKIDNGVVGGVKGEWLHAPQAAANGIGGAVILYLHGGGYCIGSPATHRAVAARLARTTRLPVFVADYRLAPEHPFPAAVDDAIAAYQALAATAPVVIAGDSAGGGLAVATALAVRQLPSRAPAALVLLSPWVDLTTSKLSAQAAGHEAVLSRAWLGACARHYLAGGDPQAPPASPVYGALRGLPPTLIQVGSDELLRGDAVAMRDALADAGVSVGCEIVPGVWHGFHLHAGMLPAANAAIDRAARFIAQHVAPPVLDPVA
jgi:acetyl esterase/lipase